jgi:hypothetical protein
MSEHAREASGSTQDGQPGFVASATMREAEEVKAKRTHDLASLLMVRGFRGTSAIVFDGSGQFIALNFRSFLFLTLQNARRFGETTKLVE